MLVNLLWRLFQATWPRCDPTLAEDALAVIPQSGDGLPRERALAQVIRWIFDEDIALDVPAAQAYLRALPGAASPIPFARLRLEVRVRKVLAVIATEIRAKGAHLTGIRGDGSERVAVDPSLLLDLTGADRSRNRIARPGLVITHLGLDEAGERNLGQGYSSPLKTRDEFLRELRAQGITPGRAGHISWAQVAQRAKNECLPKGISPSRLREVWKTLYP